MSQLLRSARIVVLIGLPYQIHTLIEAEFRERVRLHVIRMGRDGGYRLEPPPEVAAQRLEQLAGEAPVYDQLALILLPYAQIPAQVLAKVTEFKKSGAIISEPKPNDAPWPSRPKRMDKIFLDQLCVAVRTEVARYVPPEEPPADDERQVMLHLLKGLVTNKKMGRNNHSSEDDFWKSRGQNLPSGKQKRIERYLLREKLIARKKNASMGGTGWVYWINDVAKVRSLFPELEPWFQNGAA